MFVMHQNDFYDRSEGTANDSSPFIIQEDIHFFHAALVLIFVVTATYQVATAGILIIFYLLTLLYHHPRFRLKCILPLNYLIEGACAAVMVSAGILATRNRPNSWIVWLGAAASFLAFAWGSAFKDYKDIDKDQIAGNKTVYTLAQVQGWPMQNMHRIVTFILAGLMVAPTFWLHWRGAPVGRVN